MHPFMDNLDKYSEEQIKNKLNNGHTLVSPGEPMRHVVTVLICELGSIPRPYPASSSRGRLKPQQDQIRQTIWQIHLPALVLSRCSKAIERSAVMLTCRFFHQNHMDPHSKSLTLTQSMIYH